MGSRTPTHRSGSPSGSKNSVSPNRARSSFSGHDLHASTESLPGPDSLSTSMLIKPGMTCNNDDDDNTSTALTKSNLDKLNTQNASHRQPPKSPAYPSRVSTPPSMDPSWSNNALGKSSSDKQGIPQGTVLNKAIRVETFQTQLVRKNSGSQPPFRSSSAASRCGA